MVGSRIAVGAAALVLALGAGASAAHATDPVTLGAAFVLDDAAVFTPEQAVTAEERLELLSDETGIDLYVVLVDEFTSPASSQEWADEVAVANGLGVDQYLLAIAVDSRQSYISADPYGELTDAQLETVITDIRPSLRSGDYVGAIDAAADSIDSALASAGEIYAPPLIDEQTGAPQGAVTETGWFFPTLLVVVLLGGAVWLIVWFARRRRPEAPSTPVVDLTELSRRAASALVVTDDAIKTSEQELGFARAQFGDAATEEFADVLAGATDDLAEAFHLQQQLDDGEPDTDAQKLEWNNRILAVCAQINAALDERAAAFDELRDLERNAPQALEAAAARADAARAALAGCQALTADLARTYHAEAVAPVADNAEQAADRLDFAEQQLTVARSAVVEDDTSEAALAIRAAEDAIANAEQLEKAVQSLSSELPAAADRARVLLAEIEADLVAAATLADADADVAGAVTSTRTQVDSAQQLLAAAHPLAALRALEAANAHIDAVTRRARDAQEQTRRAQQAVDAVLAGAAAQITAAEDYIASRRGAVGAPARTRLAEARTEFAAAQGLQARDPAAALPRAQRADQLARQATEAAQADVSGFGESSGSSSGMMGAVIGGIIINSLLSGGGNRGGGGFGGGSGGFGGFGGGPASFGGGGTRGRRGAGGRF